MRAAIYFAPPAQTPLARLAAEWLGRDAFTGEPTREGDPARDRLVADPARYGFHATMKAPFSLTEGTAPGDLDAALAAFCADRRPAPIDRLELRRLGPFLALVPGGPHPELAALADSCVRSFEPFRAPLAEAEIQRRRPDRLSERQRAYLLEWGYPHVFEEFGFHMTLTGSLDPAEADAVEAGLRTRFAAFLGQPLRVDALALFVEPQPGAPFRVYSSHSLRAA